MFYGILPNTKTSSSSSSSTNYWSKYSNTGKARSAEDLIAEYESVYGSSAESENITAYYAFQTAQKEIQTQLKIQTANETEKDNTNNILINTADLLSLIYACQSDNDGGVTTEEINAVKIQYEIQIKYINILREYYPENEETYDTYLDNYANILSKYNLIENNFELFSTKGTDDIIDAEDLSNIYNKASSDGKYSDFSDCDLAYLTGDSSFTAQYDYDKWTETMDRINADQTASLEISSGLTTANIMSSIVLADLDENGVVSSQELSNARSSIQKRFNDISDNIETLNKLEEISINSDYTEQLTRLNATAANLKSNIDNLRYLSDNYSTFNTTGNTSFLDSDDLWNIHLASKSDGKSADLSVADIARLGTLS